MNLWITNHCKERYVERVTNGIPVDVVSILKNISAGKDITDKIYTEAPRYILYLYEKYGELGQKILLHDNVIYILKKKEGTFETYSVLTCFRNEKYLEQFKNTAMARDEIYIRIKFAKKKCRENRK
jgi:hypothetical protein